MNNKKQTGNVAAAILFLLGLIGWLLYLGLDPLRQWLELTWASMIVLIFLTGFCVVIGLSLLWAASERKQQKAREEERQASAQLAHEERQRRIKRDMKQAREFAGTTLKKIEDILKDASVSIALAEDELQEGAYSPFWDAVEAAVNDLARLDATLNELGGLVCHHKELVDEYEDDAPAMEITFSAAPEAAVVSKRLKDIVRKAQKDINFATIFEQRKTNKLLQGGFENLGAALGQIHFTVGNSIERIEAMIAHETGLRTPVSPAQR